MSSGRGEAREELRRLAPRVGGRAGSRRHTRSGVHGMSTWRMPHGANASTTAFCTAGVDPMVPDSPIPFAPSGFSGDGVSVFMVSNEHSSAALGIA
jgi:hypothetical protein